MPFNGSGVFNRLYSWSNDALNNIKIRADRMDNETNGIATALSTCITKDGQTTITADLPMANFKHTGVGAAAARTQYARTDQVQDGNLNWVDGGGTADAITATYAPAITTLIDGQLCYVRATAANATTTPTFAPNGLTARTIVKNGNVALVAGDIKGDGHELILRYRLSDTKWELLNPANAAPASETVAGIVELATDAEAQAGVDTARAITPANLQAVTGTETRKGVLELATDAEAQTGTDTARAITPANLQAVTGTETRKGVLELATDAEFQTGTDTARAITPANVYNSLGFCDVFTSTDQTITSAGGLTIAHGLGRTPTLIQIYIKCTTGANGYSINDVTPYNNHISFIAAGVGYGVSVVPDGTNLNIRFGSGGVYMLNKTTGTGDLITNSNYRMFIRAWA